MRVLGVDPGTHHLGFGVLETDGEALRCLVWGCLEAGRQEPLQERLHRLHVGLAEVADQWDPDHLAVEEPFVAPARGAKSAVAVGQAQAVALLIAAARGMPVHRYAPSQVKSAVSDYGAGTKAQVQRQVQMLLGINQGPMSEDASDALAVALCHLQHLRTAERVRPL